MNSIQQNPGKSKPRSDVFTGCGNSSFWLWKEVTPLNLRTPASRGGQPGKAFVCRWVAGPSMPSESDNSSDYSTLRTHSLGSKGMSPAAPHLDSPAFRRLACRLDHCQDARPQGFRQPRPGVHLALSPLSRRRRGRCCPWPVVREPGRRKAGDGRFLHDLRHLPEQHAPQVEVDLDGRRGGRRIFRFSRRSAEAPIQPFPDRPRLACLGALQQHADRRFKVRRRDGKHEGLSPCRYRSGVRVSRPAASTSATTRWAHHPEEPPR